MTTFLRSASAALLAFAAVSAFAAGPVEVSWGDTTRLSDAGSNSIEKDRNLQALSRHLQALGQRWLPSGQSLRVEMVDLDLAGETRPSRDGIPVRIVRGGADVPHIVLRYTLSDNGRVLRSGEDTLTDLTYLQRMPQTRSDAPLQFEKRLLDDWFQQHFAHG